MSRGSSKSWDEPREEAAPVESPQEMREEPSHPLGAVTAASRAGEDYGVPGVRRRFSGPVKMRRGAVRTIGGQTYSSGHTYPADDPNVLRYPWFFVAAAAAD